MISLKEARKLIDMGSRIGQGQRADEQLAGAVAICNLLHRERVAYLADEVGMGKTYVALGAVALFRHLNPEFRVLFIAPRENIQAKWMKEMRNFVAHNVVFADLRTKGLDGRPVRPLVKCQNLIDFVHESTLDPDRDFFLRMSSFSLALSAHRDGDGDRARLMRDKLCEYVPWLDRNAFDLRNKDAFKTNFAKGVSCALPQFDLVVVDEGHNFKHGLARGAAARNHVLSACMGCAAEAADGGIPSRGLLARRVLFLSATPVEESYRQLWNQLDVFGRGGPYARLLKDDVSEEEKKEIVSRFLIRRVTAISVGGKELTKNLYRREWRRGGMGVHDDPIHVTDLREKLTVALVQKKVSELLGHERFGSSFQIGMLASFESFLQTAKVVKDEAEEGNFDDAEQTDNELERQGVDVADVNRLASSYRRQFGMELPHPKMDAIVRALEGSWRNGEKALVFVRRVASVRELKRKLDESYDRWLFARLRKELPASVQERLEGAIRDYRRERLDAIDRETPEVGFQPRDDNADDSGGSDTFFAWFFRGAGPAGIVSGARIQQRFIEKNTTLSLFFEDNLVSWLLFCKPAEVTARLALALGVSMQELTQGLEQRSRSYLSDAKRHALADRFEALQAAALDWLSESKGDYASRARLIWNCRFTTPKSNRVRKGVDSLELLNRETFFTALRRNPVLKEKLWPMVEGPSEAAAFRDMEIRRQMLASGARLGHAFIDLYLLVVRRLGSLEVGAREVRKLEQDDSEAASTSLIQDYMALLERQMNSDPGTRDWGAFDELSAMSSNFDLIIDLNAASAREEPLAESARKFGQLLRAQQPVGGMAGQVNKTLVAQFRMPGYPFVLFTTDLLQEGEDLHAFCSSVYHYGISWTPSSMEQRTGRVDRVRSATDRRLGKLGRDPAGDELLQVYLPHLEDTVEVFQVNRVLDRMNTFMRLMHSGLAQTGSWGRRISISKEMIRAISEVPRITEPLRTAFPIRREFLKPMGEGAVVSTEQSEAQRRRVEILFQSLRANKGYVWEEIQAQGQLMGTANVGSRIQPFALHIASVDGRPALRCVSPIGNVGPDDRMEEIMEISARSEFVFGAILREDRTYDLSLEGEVLMSSEDGVNLLRSLRLIERICSQADDLERKFLPDEDAPLHQFRPDLEKEGLDGR